MTFPKQFSQRIMNNGHEPIQWSDYTELNLFIVRVFLVRLEKPLAIYLTLAVGKRKKEIRYIQESSL